MEAVAEVEAVEEAETGIEKEIRMAAEGITETEVKTREDEEAHRTALLQDDRAADMAMAMAMAAMAAMAHRMVNSQVLRDRQGLRPPSDHSKQVSSKISKTVRDSAGAARSRPSRRNSRRVPPDSSRSPS